VGVGSRAGLHSSSSGSFGIGGIERQSCGASLFNWKMFCSLSATPPPPVAAVACSPVSPSRHLPVPSEKVFASCRVYPLVGCREAVNGGRLLLSLHFRLPLHLGSAPALLTSPSLNSIHASAWNFCSLQYLRPKVHLFQISSSSWHSHTMPTGSSLGN
jgi:hypothetical protein